MNNFKKLTALLLVLGLGTVIISGCGSGKSDTKEARKLDFPKKPINLIVPWGAGGASDMVCRAFAEAAPKQFGQPVVVVNKPGGGGSIALEESKKVAADGYTIYFTPNSALVSQGLLRPLKYNIDDFRILSNIVLNPTFFFVKGDSPWKNIQDMNEDAKKNNKVLKVGHPGVGSTNDIASSAMFHALKLKQTKIPFKSNGETIAAIIGGHIDGGNFHPMEAKEFVKAGKLKPLVVFTPKRVDFYPNVPTITEAMAQAGVDFKYKNAEFSAWYLVSVPKGTPDDVYNYLVEKTQATINDPTFREKAKQMDMVINLIDSAKVPEAMKETTAVTLQVIKDTGMKAE